jgi:hypothetical protein
MRDSLLRQIIYVRRRAIICVGVGVGDMAVMRSGREGDVKVSCEFCS